MLFSGLESYASVAVTLVLVESLGFVVAAIISIRRQNAWLCLAFSALALLNAFIVRVIADLAKAKTSAIDVSLDVLLALGLGSMIMAGVVFYGVFMRQLLTTHDREKERSG